MSRLNKPCYAPPVASKKGEPNQTYTIASYAIATNYPPQYGAGISIGLIGLGGGWHQSDLDTFFAKAENRRAPVNFANIEVVYGTNSPASIEDIQRYLRGEPMPVWLPASSSIEITGGLEMVMGLAPEASLKMYFCKGLDGVVNEEIMLTSIVDTLQFLVDHPDKRPDILACSWAFSEKPYDKETWDIFAQIDTKLAVLKETTTLLFSSGNLGSTNSPNADEPTLSVAYPASSTHVTACGGAGRTLNSDELDVWNEVIHQGRDVFRLGSTGGVSAVITEQPPWQADADVAGITGQSGRGVPDIASYSSTKTGLELLIAETDLISSGTSASPPVLSTLFAAAYNSIGQKLKFVNPYLYNPEMAAGIQSINVGDNYLKPQVSPSYSAIPNHWDPCTGLGFPFNATAFTDTLGTVVSSEQKKSTPKRPRREF